MKIRLVNEYYTYPWLYSRSHATTFSWRVKCCKNVTWIGIGLNSPLCTMGMTLTLLALMSMVKWQYESAWLTNPTHIHGFTQDHTLPQLDGGL